MKHAKLLDCTLRDGAYLIDKKFGDETIRGIIDGLIAANVDVIEIGFLQDEGFGPGKTVFFNGEDAARFIPKERNNALFTVLADYSRYTFTNLDSYNGESFDAVRVCFFKKERYDAVSAFRQVKEKGYKLFVQPVDILGYSDKELIELIETVNEIEPYCFSIVDTFGSMYEEDLHHVFSVINHNLTPVSRIGFHSHNNMQMSSALSQAFLKMTYGNRDVVVDTTISGMGRGAGNTPTELIAQYMVSKLRYHYDIDAILDLIDTYIVPLKKNVEWGYSTHMFLAGTYGAHVNNITYLKQKNSIRSKDIRYILDRIGSQARKRYGYDLLENTYLNYMNSDIDDSESFNRLQSELQGKTVVIVAPGKSVSSGKASIEEYVNRNNASVISINFVPSMLKSDYLYMSNVRRYEMFHHSGNPIQQKKIFTSNISKEADANTYCIAFNRLYKCGWEYADNSAILLLRLLKQLGVKKAAIAGLDGYDPAQTRNPQYAEKSMEIPIPEDAAIVVNREIGEMLDDIVHSGNDAFSIEFITPSRFEWILRRKENT